MANELKMERSGMPLRRRVQLAVVFLVPAIFGGVFAACSNTGANLENKTYTLPANVVQPTPAAIMIENADFSKFQHFNQKHAELSCLMCHRSEENQTATPKLPGHITCSGCHSDQFTPNSSSTICSICHTDAQTGALKNFPPLKSFGVVFSHAKHVGQTNCATCHKPTRAGVALSIPSKFNAHASCFQCHAPGSEMGAGNTQSCATCHQQGSPPRAVPETAKAFTLSFNHSRHRSMTCTECHKIQQGSTRGNQVTAITAAMHFPPKGTQSCASCHNNKRAFGGTDFSDCKKCHQGNSFKF